MKRSSNPSSSGNTSRRRARPAEENLTQSKKARYTKEEEKIDSLFHVYIEDSSAMIGKMEAERQGYFTLEEWRRGLKSLHADTITEIKKALSKLEKEVARPSNFANFYSFAFRYCLIEDMQKCIDIESACELLDLVLGLQYRPQTTKLVAYLKHQHEYKVINRDQWDNFLGFCSQINFPSLDNYDHTLGWPLILDNFVAWMHEMKFTDPSGIGNADGTVWETICTWMIVAALMKSEALLILPLLSAITVFSFITSGGGAKFK